MHTEKHTPCEEDALLSRVRQHIRTGRRRLNNGKICLGIIALYDALHAAMQWYIACPGQANKLLPISADNVHDDRRLFDILVRSGVLTSAFDYRAFSDLVESAVYKNMSSFNYSALLTDIESVMKQLGVTPGTDSTALAVESCISGNH